MAKLIKCIKCKEKIDSKSKFCTCCGEKVKPQPSLWYGLIAAVIVGGTLIYCVGGNEKTLELKDKVNFSYSITKNSLGMTKGNFKITNNNDVIIKDISITCVNYSKTNAILNDIHAVIYDGVGVGVTRSFNNVDMGMSDKNTAKSLCVIGRVKKF